MLAWIFTFVGLFLSLSANASENYIPKVSKDGKLNKISTYPKGTPLETATFAGGCFWGVESAFRQVEGVTETVVGYSGGKKEKPTYYQVSAGDTGHAESVQVTYNPKVVSYRKLLEIFFQVHDPTTLNRQGPDVGSQYRSAIFYHSDEQRKQSNEIIQSLKDKFSDPIVTQVAPFEVFYPGEDYHQQYFEKIAKRKYGIK